MPDIITCKIMLESDVIYFLRTRWEAENITSEKQEFSDLSIQMRLWWHRVVSNSCNPSAHRHDRILRTFRSQQQQKTNQKNGCRGRGGGRGRGVSKIQWQERRCCEEGRAVRTYWAWGHRNARCGRHGWSAGWPSSSAVCTWVPSRDLPHPLHPRSQALCSPAWTIAEAYHT